MMLPKDIKWGPAAGLPGTDAYTLVGDPAKPGFYIVLNRFVVWCDVADRARAKPGDCDEGTL